MVNFKKMTFLKGFALLLMFAAIVVSIAGAAHIGYSYAEMQCMIEHGGASAPIDIVFTMLVPYCLVVLVMLGAGILLYRVDVKRHIIRDATIEDIKHSEPITDYVQDSKINK